MYYTMSSSQSKFDSVCSDIVNQLLETDAEKEDVESIKMDICSKYGSEKVPSNGDLLSRAGDNRDELISITTTETC
jgi:Histone acetyltransferase